MDEFKGENFIFSNPMKCPSQIAKLQERILENCSPEEIYYSETPEVAATLVKSGFGITLFPQDFVPNDGEISQILVGGLESLSFGIYYKTLKGNPMLRDFVNVATEVCSRPTQRFR